MRTSMGLVAKIASVTVAVGMVASCSPEVGGSPAATEEAPASTAASAVPRVANPLDVASYLKRPCELVNEKVVSSIGSFEPPEPDIDSKTAKKLTGPRCGWFPARSGPTIGVVIDTVNGDAGNSGIQSVYDGKETGIIEYTERKQIPGHPGYPAVVAGTSNEVTSGQCPLHVGVSDDLLVIVTVTNDDKPDQACPAALKVGASVLDTLKKGS